MLRKKYVSLLILVTGFWLFLPTTKECGSTYGACLPNDFATYRCANFGGSIIEFLGVKNYSCTLTDSSSAPCTIYFYKYEGLATNQVNIAIPKPVTTVINEAGEINCSQVYSLGEGDPVTNFGIGLLSMNVCRSAPSFGALPPSPPDGANFFIRADPSHFDNKKPLDWQVRFNKTEVYRALLVGPASLVAPVAETAVTLTSSNGSTCSYAIEGGQVVLVNCPSGSYLPVTDAKLCLPAKLTQTPTFGTWYCENISFVTDQCDIKTAGYDPCRSSGGGLLCW